MVSGRELLVIVVIVILTIVTIVRGDIGNFIETGVKVSDHQPAQLVFDVDNQKSRYWVETKKTHAL